MAGTAMSMSTIIATLTCALVIGCGRIDFHAQPGDATPTLDGPPVTIRVGERPGDTSLGTSDTYLDPLSPDVAHGGSEGMQCDIPDYTLLRFALPTPRPAYVIAAQVHIGVTNDLLEAGVVELYENTLDWAELEATWNVRKTGVPWPTPGGDGAHATTPFGSFDGRLLFTDYVVDVPVDIVERWWSGSNFGIGVLVTATGVNFATHDSSLYPDLRPELVVTYQP